MSWRPYVDPITLQGEILFDRADIQLEALLDTLAQLQEVLPADHSAQTFCRIARSILC